MMDETLKALLEQNNRLIELIDKTISRALPEPLPPIPPAPAEPEDFTDWTDGYYPVEQQYGGDNRFLIVDDGVPNDLEDELDLDG